MTSSEPNKMCSIYHAKAGDKYGGQTCKEAGSREVEIAGQCDHRICPLTAWGTF
jgi:hypothetical protein